MKYTVYGYIKDVVPCTWEVEAEDKDEAMQKIKDYDGEGAGIVEHRTDWNGYIQLIPEDAEEVKNEKIKVEN